LIIIKASACVRSICYIQVCMIFFILMLIKKMFERKSLVVAFGENERTQRQDTINRFTGLVTIINGDTLTSYNYIYMYIYIYVNGRVEKEKKIGDTLTICSLQSTIDDKKKRRRKKKRKGEKDGASLTNH
jgi:amino acid transporter